MMKKVDVENFWWSGFGQNSRDDHFFWVNNLGQNYSELEFNVVEGWNEKFPSKTGSNNCKSNVTFSRAYLIDQFWLEVLSEGCSNLISLKVEFLSKRVMFLHTVHKNWSSVNMKIQLKINLSIRFQLWNIFVKLL